MRARQDFIDWLHALRTAKALVLGLNLAEVTSAKEVCAALVAGAGA